MTIYKLRDHQTNQEFLEFDEDIVFQTSCPGCLNIKSCLLAGHQLEDWQPRSVEVRDGHASGGSAPPPTSPAPSPSSQSTGTGSGKRSSRGPPLLKGVAADGSDGGAAATTTPTARGRGKYARAEAGEKVGAGGAPGSAGDEKVTAAGARRRSDTEAQHVREIIINICMLRSIGKEVLFFFFFALFLSKRILLPGERSLLREYFAVWSLSPHRVAYTMSRRKALGVRRLWVRVRVRGVGRVV